MILQHTMRGSDVGFPDSFQGYNPKYYSLLTILDSLFACLILSPCVVGYWRSVWTLMDIYVYPNNEWLSALVSTAIGFGGHLFFSLSQKVFKRHFHPSKNRILFYLVSRLYTLCFAFVCVNGWRGPWHMLDIHAKKKFFTLLVTTMVGVVALISIRGLRNVSATPFIVVNDKIKGYFEVITMFRISVEEMSGLFILDCLFSILIVGTLVVFVWRGSWTLVDIFLFPENHILSFWGSLVIGYVTVAIAFCLQPFARYLCETLSGTPRLLVSDLLHIFALFGTVNIWRGIWNLLDIYFIPDNPELSNWITHWVSFLMLVLLGCSNSLLVRGVYIDAEEPAGKCVEFPCHYLRVIFQKEKLRKLKLKTINSEDNSKAQSKNEKTVENVKISVIQKSIMENSSSMS